MVAILDFRKRETGYYIDSDQKLVDFVLQNWMYDYFCYLWFKTGQFWHFSTPLYKSSVSEK